MSKHDPAVTLRQLLLHAQRVQELVTESSLAELAENWRFAAAFEREIEIIGEAVKRLPETIKSQHPEIPWRQIAGARDRLIHGYDAVDYAILWDATQNDLPELIEAVRQSLDALR